MSQSYCVEDADEAEEEEQLFETWLLLEYCDKGSLQDAVDRGWFHTDKHGHVDSKTKSNMRAIRSALVQSTACLLCSSQGAWALQFRPGPQASMVLHCVFLKLLALPDSSPRQSTLETPDMPLQMPWPS